MLISRHMRSNNLVPVLITSLLLLLWRKGLIGRGSGYVNPFLGHWSVPEIAVVGRR
jgi:hypothetical protein